VVASGHEVDRHPHQRPLDDLAALERPGEVRTREPVATRPQPDVRRWRVLRLETADPLEGPPEATPAALEQRLSREQRAVQPTRRERGSGDDALSPRSSSSGR
jgi:hypothetical protein